MHTDATKLAKKQSARVHISNSDIVTSTRSMAGHHRASMALIFKFCFLSNSSLQLTEQLEDSSGQEHKVMSCTMCYYVGYAVVFQVVSIYRKTNHLIL